LDFSIHLIPVFFQYIFIVLMGAILGSFTTAVIHRAKSNQSYISNGNKAARSKCVSCGHQLGWKNLMPVLSWVFQKGKCKYCQVKISKFYPIIEIISIIWALLIFKFVGLPSVIIFLPIIPYLIGYCLKNTSILSCLGF